MFELIEVGQTGKTRGYKGELLLFVEDQYLPDVRRSKVLFFHMGGQDVPFFIEGIRGEGDAFLKLEEVDSREAANDLTNMPVFLKREDINQAAKQQSTFSLERLTGFQVRDQDGNLIGTIDQMEEYPEQWMALVRRGEDTWLIPVVDDYILDMRPEGKLLVVDLPEGLLEI